MNNTDKIQAFITDIGCPSIMNNENFWGAWNFVSDIYADIKHGTSRPSRLSPYGRTLRKYAKLYGDEELSEITRLSGIIFNKLDASQNPRIAKLKDVLHDRHKHI